MDTEPNLAGTNVNRPDKTPTLTLASPSPRLALPPPPSNSADKRGVMKTPTRAPAPKLLFMLRPLLQDVLLPKAPNSIVPRCCAVAGGGSAGAARRAPYSVFVLWYLLL